MGVETMETENKQQADTDEMGVCYILGHSYMPSVIKIGFTSNLADRMRSLDQSSSIPVPFECIFAAKVPNPRLWERTLHTVFDESRVNQKREFFDIGVMAKAIAILQAAKVEDATSSAPSVAQTGETPSESRRNSSRRERFDFEKLQVAEGEILTFITPDENGEEICCLVSQQRPPRVMYGDIETSLAEATARVFGASRSLTGLAYWKFGNETLMERRVRLESEDDE